MTGGTLEGAAFSVERRRGEHTSTPLVRRLDAQRAADRRR